MQARPAAGDGADDFEPAALITPIYADCRTATGAGP